MARSDDTSRAALNRDHCVRAKASVMSELVHDSKGPAFDIAAQLPDRPLLVLEPAKGWSSLDLRDVWAHRELLYFLAWRDIKLRYKQTMLGVLWAVIQPLFPMIIFTFVFGRLAKMPSEGTPYAVFVYAGLLPWTYFANAVASSATSIVGSSNLVSKVYFPRMIIPASAVLAALLDFCIAGVLLGLLMMWYGLPVHSGVIMLPVLIALTTTLSLGIGLLCAGLTVKYRDIRYALPFLIQCWMFATPVVFPTSMVPSTWRWALVLNPLTGIIDGFRSALFGRPFNWGALAASAAIAIVGLVYAAYSFRRLERTFADTI
jgi:lipopolysaccharide transport system permease protein